jgi:hypothetical protein
MRLVQRHLHSISNIYTFPFFTRKLYHPLPRKPLKFPRFRTYLPKGYEPGAPQQLNNPLNHQIQGIDDVK